MLYRSTSEQKFWLELSLLSMARPNCLLIESPRWHLDWQWLTKPADTESAPLDVIQFLTWLYNAGPSVRLASRHVFHIHIIVNTQLSWLVHAWCKGKHHLQLIIHYCLPDAKIVFPVVRWAAMRCMSAHLPLVSSGPVLSACEWGAEAGTWQGHREDQMELALSSARTRGNNVAFAYFLSERTETGTSPESSIRKKRIYFPNTDELFHLWTSFPCTWSASNYIAGRLHDVVLWKWQFFFWLDMQGGKWWFSAKTTMSLNTGAPTLVLARVVSRCI